MGKAFTVSEVRVFGTATRSCSSSDAASLDDEGIEVIAKEQKFMVFTWRRWSIHGCGRGSGGVSTGRTTLIDFSSSSDNFQTMSLLSFPCLH